MRQLAMTIFSATQRYNVVVTLLRMAATLNYFEPGVVLKIIVANRSV